MPHGFTAMATAERTEYLLNSLIEGESLDGILEFSPVLLKREPKPTATRL